MIQRRKGPAAKVRAEGVVLDAKRKKLGTKPMPKKKKLPQKWLAKRNSTITPAQLLAEGIDDPRKDIGAIAGTAVCFVRTKLGLHLFHVTRMEERRLDEYALQLVKGWFESGHTMVEIASNLGIDKMHLIHELDRIGYQRPALNVPGPRAGTQQRLTRRSRARRLIDGERLPAIDGKHSGKHRVPTIHYLLA